jgi:hypothetical protein
MGHNMVKFSSPNMPSTWLIFLYPHTHTKLSESLTFIRTREREREKVHCKCSVVYNTLYYYFSVGNVLLCVIYQLNLLYLCILHEYHGTRWRSGWGTALQTRRSRDRFPMVSLEFFIDTILPVTLWPWGWLSLQRKWVLGIFPGGKGSRCVGLTTLPLSCASTFWNPQGLSMPVMGLLCFYMGITLYRMRQK